MATVGQYRIGPSDFFTPGDLLADAATLNGQMNLLDDQDWTKPAQSLFDGWFYFLAEWRKFYSSNFSGYGSALVASLNDSNRDQLIQFENRFGEFVNEWQAATGLILPGGIIGASSGAQDTLGQHLKNQLQPLVPSLDIGKVLLVVGLVVAAGAVYFFRAPLGRALSTGAA